MIGTMRLSGAKEKYPRPVKRLEKAIDETLRIAKTDVVYWMQS